MNQKTAAVILTTLLIILILLSLIQAQKVSVRGKDGMRRWHKITLTLEGPKSSEQAVPNPFLDYRFNVIFRHTTTKLTYTIPGYFAADHRAADSSADSGNIWLAHLSPDHTGRWTYEISFRKGKGIAVDEKKEAGDPLIPFDKLSGSFIIEETDKKGRDLRAKGRLQYVNKHFLRFAGTKEYFLKQGPDAPENFLAYADFDGDFKTDRVMLRKNKNSDDLIKTWAPHIQDWRPGDPIWKNNKGKGIIGAVNYLASEGMNVFSFLTLNIEGDDRNVFPYTTYQERERMDVSKLAQWERVFEHADKMGFYLHFKMQETENELLLDNGETGKHRRLYFRELIARFSHHLALNWNLGEENRDQTHEQRKAMAQYFYDHDPYHHLIVVHTHPGAKQDIYPPLLGDKSKLTGASLQGRDAKFLDVHPDTLEWVRRSAEAGKPWVVAVDEPGKANLALLPDRVNPNHDMARINALWGTFMAGGAGNEWYFGYAHEHSDLTCQDFRSRDLWWDQCRHALRFFKKYDIPFWEMKSDDSKLKGSPGFCLYKPGEIFLFYLKEGVKKQVDLDLSGETGSFQIKWYDPRKGGNLLQGSKKTVSRGKWVNPGSPPDEKEKDWLLYLRKIK